MEKIVFDYTKHKELWEYMAQEETIKNIINRAKEEIITIEESISRTKREFIKDKYNMTVTCSCFACDAHDRTESTTCFDCPIYIGDCTNNSGYGLYVRYKDYIRLCIDTELYKKEDKDFYLSYAQEYALKIANANLNKESIEKFDIEVI